MMTMIIIRKKWDSIGRKEEKSSENMRENGKIW